MDDDANKLLIEIRDILRESSESQAAWRKEILANSKRGQRIVRFFILPFLLIMLVLIAGGIFSSGQAERERAQEERRYHEELKRYREEIQRKMEERRDQLIRPKALGRAQKSDTITLYGLCLTLEMTPLPRIGTGCSTMRRPVRCATTFFVGHVA